MEGGRKQERKEGRREGGRKVGRRKKGGMEGGRPKTIIIIILGYYIVVSKLMT